MSSTSPRARHRTRRRLRSAPWHGEAHACQLIPRDVGLISVDEIAEACTALHASGFRRVLTPALGGDDLAPFVAAGFTVHEGLHLLRFDLSGSLPDGVRTRTRRARRSDLPSVLGVDHAAFEPFWQLGEQGINEAVAATPQSRFRVVHRPACGYIICGYSLRRGYIQRLAVHPERQGAGLGRGLLLDALEWLAQRRATSVLVNTQVSNTRAVDLYEGLGFTLQPEGLSVLVHEDPG